VTTLTEKDLRAYYREKISIVLQLEEKWREIARSAPGRVLKNLPAAERLVEELNGVDARYAEKFGEREMRESLTLSPPSPVSQARDDLRARLTSATATLMSAKSRLQDLRRDLGRKLSHLKSRRRQARHGDFDRSA